MSPSGSGRDGSDGVGEIGLLYISPELADLIEDLASKRRVTVDQLIRSAMMALEPQMFRGPSQDLSQWR